MLLTCEGMSSARNPAEKNDLIQKYPLERDTYGVNFFKKNIRLRLADTSCRFAAAHAQLPKE